MIDISTKKKEDGGELLSAYNLAGQAISYFANDSRAVRHLTLRAKNKNSRANCHVEERADTTDPGALRHHVELKILAAFCGDIAVQAFSHAAKPVFDPNQVTNSVDDAARRVCGSDMEREFFVR